MAQRKSSFTIVLDPGHGGGDSGAVGNGAVEKKINLAVALEVRRMIQEQYPEVRVLMTRSTDVFIGLSERARFANRSRADLFMSIHANSSGGSSRAKGTETYVLGLNRSKDNLRVAMRENQSILLEKDYSVKYQGFDPSSTESYIIFEMMQNAHLQESIKIASAVQRSFSAIGRSDRSVRQDVFLVLRETAMPSILVELGFVTNPEEASYLMSDKGHHELATAIVKGFGRYYASVRGKASVPAKASASQKDSIEKEVPSEELSATSKTEKVSSNASKKNKGEVCYRIQIASSTQPKNTKDAFFARLGEVRSEKIGNRYHYTVSSADTLSEARTKQRDLQKRFPDCFIVEYRKGERTKTIY